MRRLLAALALVAAAGCTGGDARPAPTSANPAPTSASPAPSIFDPAVMEAALLAERDLGEGWVLVGEAGSGVTGLFRFCGDSWTGLGGARGPRERIWNSDDDELLLQDVRRYDQPASGRTALDELADLASCPDVTDIEAPSLGDGSHVFGMEFQGRDVVAGFVLAGRYGTVVVTDADPPVPLLRRAADKLKAYAAANP